MPASFPFIPSPLFQPDKKRPGWYTARPYETVLAEADALPDGGAPLEIYEAVSNGEFMYLYRFENFADIFRFLDGLGDKTIAREISQLLIGKIISDREFCRTLTENPETYLEADESYPELCSWLQDIFALVYADRTPAVIDLINDPQIREHAHDRRNLRDWPDDLKQSRIDMYVQRLTDLISPASLLKLFEKLDLTHAPEGREMLIDLMCRKFPQVKKGMDGFVVGYPFQKYRIYLTEEWAKKHVDPIDIGNYEQHGVHFVKMAFYGPKAGQFPVYHQSFASSSFGGNRLPYKKHPSLYRLKKSGP